MAVALAKALITDSIYSKQLQIAVQYAFQLLYKLC